MSYRQVEFGEMPHGLLGLPLAEFPALRGEYWLCNGVSSS